MATTNDSHGTLRVFEADRAPRGALEVDLPIAWARPHSRVAVELRHTGRDMGWHAQILGDDNEYLLGFPWHDNIDETLRADPSSLPINLEDERWDDLEQGWWAVVIPVESWVYLAETDLDALVKVEDAPKIVCHTPGIVHVDGVEVRWARAARHSYEAAWSAAAARVRSRM